MDETTSVGPHSHNTAAFTEPPVNSVDVSQPKEEWKASPHVLLILVSLALVSLVVALDATILVPALPTIAKELNGTASETFWAVTAYLLTSSTPQPLIVALSDVFGRREALFTAIVFFTAGSLISCLAQNFPTLLAGRAIKGIGGGGIISMNLVIITDIIPLRQRPKYYAGTQIAWAVGTITGPLIGGAIVENATWRLLFYINFPFCAIGLVTIPWVVRLSRRESVGIWQSLSNIDWTGSALFMASTTSFLIGVTWSGHLYGWGTYQVLVPLILGVAGLVVLGVWELKVTDAPFIRKTMLKSRPLMTVYACTCLQGFMLYAHIYYIAQYLLSVQERSPILTGVCLLPISIGIMPGSAVAGLAMSKIGTWKWAVWLGWAVNMLGSGLCILLDESISIPAWVFIFLALGLGQGILISAHNIAVQAIAGPRESADATALFTFTRSVGLCLGAGIGGTIFQSRLSDLLSSRGLPAAIAENAEAFIFELLKMDASPQKAAITGAYSDAFVFLFQIITGICGFALLLSFTIPGHFPLDRALDSDHVLQDMKKTREGHDTRAP